MLGRGKDGLETGGNGALGGREQLSLLEGGGKGGATIPIGGPGRQQGGPPEQGDADSLPQAGTPQLAEEGRNTSRTRSWRPLPLTRAPPLGPARARSRDTQGEEQGGSGPLLGPAPGSFS